VVPGSVLSARLLGRAHQLVAAATVGIFPYRSRKKKVRPLPGVPCLTSNVYVGECAASPPPATCDTPSHPQTNLSFDLLLSCELSNGRSNIVQASNAASKDGAIFVLIAKKKYDILSSQETWTGISQLISLQIACPRFEAKDRFSRP
jgi:hypothetical protein